jgi:hypothetical protein
MYAAHCVEFIYARNAVPSIVYVGSHRVHLVGGFLSTDRKTQLNGWQVASDALIDFVFDFAGVRHWIQEDSQVRGFHDVIAEGVGVGQSRFVPRLDDIDHTTVEWNGDVIE